MLDKIQQYLAEKSVWVEAGKPIRSAETMREIHDICKACPLFKARAGNLPGYDQCGECGCNLHPSAHYFNKIAWGTTKCPKSPPEWTEDRPE